MNDSEKSPRVVSLGDRCCGCGACAARCPKSSISMEPDDCGFLHPTVDASGCVGCGACDAVCPALNAPGEDGCEFALWAKAHDVGLLDRSSSGGVFGLLAGDALSRGGVVAGAAWTDGCRELRHVLVEDRPALGAVMRSKYVQSAVGRGVFEGVRTALREGRPALFAGWLACAHTWGNSPTLTSSSASTSSATVFRLQSSGRAGSTTVVRPSGRTSATSICGVRQPDGCLTPLCTST